MISRWCQDCNSGPTLYFEDPETPKTLWRHEDKQLCITNLQRRNQELAELYGRLGMKNGMLQQRAQLAESRASKAEEFMRRLAPLTRYGEVA